MADSTDPRDGPPDDLVTLVPDSPTRARTKRSAMIGAGAIVAAAAVTGSLLYSHYSQSKQVALPASFHGYTKLTSDAAARVESRMRSLGRQFDAGSGTDLFDAASVGVYSRRSHDMPALVVLTVRTSNLPDSAGASPEDVTAKLVNVVSPTSAVFRSGRHAGSTRCAETRFGQVTETFCAWSDYRTTGMIVSVNSFLTPRHLARLENAFREHVD